MIRKIYLSIATGLLLFAGLNAQNSFKKINGIENCVNAISFNSNNQNEVTVASYLIPVDLTQQDIEFFNFAVEGGYRVSTNQGESFGGLQLEQRQVMDIKQDLKNATTWYAAVVQNRRGRILKSTDNRATWSEENISCEGAFQFLQLVQNPVQTDEFYLAAVNTSRGFTSTDNNFQSCKPNETIVVSVRNIVVDKFNPNRLYLAADSKYTNGVFVSDDRGKTWIRRNSGINNLRILCVQPSGVKPNVIYCGADSLSLTGRSIGKGIYRSEDGGLTWELWAAHNYAVFSITEHPSKPQFMAASGVGRLWISGSWGNNWDEVTDGFIDTTQIQKVAIPEWGADDDSFTVFAGTFIHGLYKGTNLKPTILSVENQSITDFELVSIFPNPASDLINLNINAEIETKASISITDVLGNNIYNQSSIYLNIGYNEIPVNLTNLNLPNGSYFVSVIINGNRILKPFVKF